VVFSLGWSPSLRTRKFASKCSELQCIPCLARTWARRIPRLDPPEPLIARLRRLIFPVQAAELVRVEVAAVLESTARIQEGPEPLK